METTLWTQEQARILAIDSWMKMPGGSQYRIDIS